MTDPVLVSRRIRNRIIEYLKLVASPKAQLDYQARAPIAHVPSEVINQWEDWTSGDPVMWPEALSAEVYAPEEIEAMQRFHATWDAVAGATPDPLPPLAETLKLAEWAELSRAASDALAVFSRRGLLAE